MGWPGPLLNDPLSAGGVWLLHGPGDLLLRDRVIINTTIIIVIEDITIINATIVGDKYGGPCVGGCIVVELGDVVGDEIIGDWVGVISIFVLLSLIIEISYILLKSALRK